MERTYHRIHLKAIGGTHVVYVQGKFFDPLDDDIVSHAVSLGHMDPDEMELVERVEEITEAEYLAKPAYSVVNMETSSGKLQL